MDFDHPLILYAAPAGAIVFFSLAYWARRARVSRAARWSANLRAVAARQGSWGTVWLGLVAGAAFAALAGPRWGTRVVETESKGLSLVVAVDISRSMLAEDVEPSRLARAKREARRLVHDLSGDRIGLVAFAGQGHVLSPLTVDGSALYLLVEALDPELASSGGSALARALEQGLELLLAGDEVADRVLAVFTDGEAHDSLPEIIAQAERLRRNGVHLVLVAEGGRDPVRIPVRDLDGQLVGHQLDPGGEFVETRRRDDILAAVADAAQGVLVSAEVGDQAGRVRELVAAFKRSPLATTTAAQDISRAWIPLLAAVVALLLHTVTRKTAALASILLSIGLPGEAGAQRPRNDADEAWRDGRPGRAAEMYLLQAAGGDGGDTTWFNFGAAALAAGDTGAARNALGRAAQSVEPDIRFRARYNLGTMELLLAVRDSANLTRHLDEARKHYTEALLLRPRDVDTKWNLELAVSLVPAPADAGSSPQQGSGSGDEDTPPAEPQGLSEAQAEQILNSIAEEERRTLQRLNSLRRRLGEARGRRDW